MKLLNLLFLSILILFISCGKNKPNQEDITSEEKEKMEIEQEESIFKKKLLEEPKIFLKFWEGMNSEEYYKVSKILEEEGVLENGMYLMGKNKLIIKSFRFVTNDNNEKIFSSSFALDYNSKNLLGSVGEKQHEKIDGIELYGFDEETYNIFKDKYNLPNYIYKKNNTYILEENPLYENPNTDEHQAGKRIKVLDEYDLKNGVAKDFFVIKNDTYGDWHLPPSDTDLRELSIENDIIIERDNNVLFFTYIYGGANRDPYYYIYKNNDKNTPLRIALIRNYSRLSLFYINKSTFNEVKRKEQEKRNKDINEEKLKIKKTEERTYEVYNEI